MRREEIELLEKPYGDALSNEVNFFDKIIGASLPSANKLAKEILNDLDHTTFGVRWWSVLPTQERILIGDYLYQCCNGIELNLAEAKLHYFEWLDAREQRNNQIADGIVIDRHGVRFKHATSESAKDDLPERIEKLHLGGFFRAIGSSLDCLGATIVAVLGLKTSLRRADLRASQKALREIPLSNDIGIQLQLRFFQFLQDLEKAVGPDGWLEWTSQCRNMLVHRGRRSSSFDVVPKENLLFDARGRIIPRATSKMHLARYPDRSEIEALVRTKANWLNEDAESTLDGVFLSCQKFEERTCEELCSIWDSRRKNPSLIEQPLQQWNAKIQSTSFRGYITSAQPFTSDTLTVNPSFRHRILAAAVDDAHRGLWNGSQWAQ